MGRSYAGEGTIDIEGNVKKKEERQARCQSTAVTVQLAPGCRGDSQKAREISLGKGTVLTREADVGQGQGGLSRALLGL